MAVFQPLDQPSEVVALVRGEVGGENVPLVRLHSECLTGDTLGSLRCDCGPQLVAALDRIAAAKSGVLLYLRQEGRGIGIANKIRAYALQDQGLDTVDANVALGLPIDSREYGPAAAVLRQLGVGRLRLLTNNPAKADSLLGLGIAVVERVPLEVPPNASNLAYLRAKAGRMGHVLTLLGGEQIEPDPGPAPGSGLPVPTGAVTRPAVTVHYAQTLDGRIATRTGNSQWISGEGSLRLAHELRASHDAVLVGVGTVLADDPLLTVRLVAGASPRRIVVDSQLRLPTDARVLTTDPGSTIVATTAAALPSRARAIEAIGATVLVVDSDAEDRVELANLLDRLGQLGVRSVLVEGGGKVITSLLRAGLVHRLVVCIAPKVVGAGIEAIGDLDIHRLSDALTFARAGFTALGDDMVFDGEVERAAR